MNFPSALKAPLMAGIDSLMALWPRPRPALERLRAAKVIAHRGLTTEGALENTIQAFQDAASAGAWGIEFDIRWSACETPVIHHDPHLERVFKNKAVIASSKLAVLRKAAPDIAMFDEILERFAGKTHMMIEIKDPVESLTRRKIAGLQARLKNFEPVRDYHVMSLDEAVFKHLDFVPPEAWLPIAEFDVAKFSKFALDHKTAGLAGQYVLLGTPNIERHHNAGQLIGTGFVNSRSVLFRELNRGVDWIFSDRAKLITDVIKNESH